ncbi:MAG TPA: cadherin repeat domain-containing protein [Candidatus Baltobacteraceae bacterium]|nr:cadherin repeat domain-containing protein [Candidatus Baltobacteraceae bacterium]
MTHQFARFTSVLALAIAAAIGLPALAMNMGAGVTMTKVAGPYRIVLQLLPAEPFYTQAQYAKEHPKAGMLVVRGAAPVRLDAPTHPNHHLIVHVYDNATGKAQTTATVAIRYAPASGPARNLPIVEMQAIGKGAQSTHYGNNVYLPNGSYTVTVDVNGNTSIFHVTAKAASMSKM